MPSFTRRCPNCGKLFGVKATGKKLVDTETRVEEKTVDVPVGPVGRGSPAGPGSYVARQEIVRYQEDKWEVSFQCTRCGHTWTETKVSLQKS